MSTNRRKGQKSIHFSSVTGELETPFEVFDKLNHEFGFTLDVCSTHENAKCKRHFTRLENGLAQSWAGEVGWMNPPYGREIWDWMEKAYSAARFDKATVVCLVPSRTDTAWWHEFSMKGEIRFIRGRLKFGGHVNAAPFPSAIVIFRGNSVLER